METRSRYFSVWVIMKDVDRQHILLDSSLCFVSTACCFLHRFILWLIIDYSDIKERKSSETVVVKACMNKSTNYVTYTVVHNSVQYVSSLVVFCLISLCSAGFNQHLSRVLQWLYETSLTAGLWLDHHLGNPAVNSHPDQRRTLSSNPEDATLIQQTNTESVMMLSVERPPLQSDCRAMFVGVVQMHQSRRWMEWTPAAAVQHSNDLPVN